MAREDPYITIKAEAPLDQRWTPELWFAWSRLLATCRLKRACTADTWPAAVLRLRPHELCSIVAKSTVRSARALAEQLPLLASCTVRAETDHAGLLFTITVHKYAEYQKLGRPTSARSSKDVSDPPHDPTTLRKKEESLVAADAAPDPPAGGSQQGSEESEPTPDAQRAQPATDRPPPPDPPPQPEPAERPTRARGSPEPSADAVTFAEDFRQALAKVHGQRFKLPTSSAFRGWQREADLMLRRDARPLDEARAIASWLFTSEDEDAQFWRTNVLGVPKFRQRYDQLAIKWRARKEGHARRKAEVHRGSRLLAWANG